MKRPLSGVFTTAISAGAGSGFGLVTAEAADFETNPFSEAFQRVDEAVARKQAYETRQIKDLFHGPEGKADLDMTAALTEKARTPLADAIRAAFVPVRHTICVQAER